MSSVPSKAVALVRKVLRAVLPPPPKEVIWRFLEKNVIIPQIAGSRASGRLDTGLMPIWRGLLEKYSRRHVRYFTIAKAARIGGTLFFGICLIIEKVLRNPGPIGWVDPTGKTAKSVSRREITPYLEASKPIREVSIFGRETWTWAEKFFTNCLFSILGAGSINDFGGRQWELTILNEQDRIPNRTKDSGPTPTNEAEVRSSQFEQTRKIVRNSTPFSDGGLTWSEFLAGSQEYGYCPCPECGGYQRLTMFKEPEEPDKPMRIEADDPMLATSPVPILHGVHGTRPADALRPAKPPVPSRDGTFIVMGIPETGQIYWPPECKLKSGRYDLDKVARSARYECAFCKAHLRPEQMHWMRERYQLRSHNPEASRDHVSVQISSLWSPWTSIGSIAKAWLLAQGAVAKLHDFFNLIIGTPAPAAPTKVTPRHLALLQKASPKYFRQFPEIRERDGVPNVLTLHIRPVVLMLKADVQQDLIWYTLSALCLDGSRHLLAWGNCGGFTEINNIASRQWLYEHTDEPAGSPHRFEAFTCYSAPVATCIIDTGHRSKNAGGVYEFIHEQEGKWVGARGGDYKALGSEKPITQEMRTFNYAGSKRAMAQVDVPVIKMDDHLMTEHLSRFVLREHREPGYRLPAELDEHLVEHLTSPYLQKKRLPDGRTKDEWHWQGENHLYDCEKYGEGLCFIFEPAILAKLRERQDKARMKKAA